jgi:hypothetical protein
MKQAEHILHLIGMVDKWGIMEREYEVAGERQRFRQLSVHVPSIMAIRARRQRSEQPIARVVSAEIGTAVGQETALSPFSGVRRTSGCTVKSFAPSFGLFPCSIDHECLRPDRTKVANSDECLYRCPFPH